MINKKELARIAEAKNLSLKNCERDYLQDVVLFCIYRQIKNELVFKGGTALYKIYSLNRFSEDLDFTLNKPKLEVERLVKAVLGQVESLGIIGKLRDFVRYRNEINIKLEFRGPLYAGGKESLVLIPLNISLRERILFNQEFIFASYSEIPSFEVCVSSAEEILAEKVRAILTREKPRDVYDFWFLLKKGVKLDLALVNKKLKICGMVFDKLGFFNKVQEKKRFWGTDLQGLMAAAPDFDRIFEEIRHLV